MEMMSFIEFVVRFLLLLLWLKSTVLIAWALSESYMMRRSVFFKRYDSGEIQIGNWKRNKNKFYEWVWAHISRSLNLVNDHLSFILWINKFQIVSDGLWYVCATESLTTDFKHHINCCCCCCCPFFLFEIRDTHSGIIIIVQICEFFLWFHVYPCIVFFFYVAMTHISLWQRERRNVVAPSKKLYTNCFKWHAFQQSVAFSLSLSSSPSQFGMQRNFFSYIKQRY